MDTRIKANTERRSLLEASLEEAQTILSQRGSVKNDLDAIAERAQDMAEFLKESELSDRKAFAETFIREIVLKPGRAVILYRMPMPSDSYTLGADSGDISTPRSFPGLGFGQHRLRKMYARLRLQCYGGGYGC